MSCREFIAIRRKTCPARNGQRPMPARCMHIYRRHPPQDAQCTMEALQNVRQRYGCDHYHTPSLRHRRIPDEYEMPNPGQETEDAPEKETESGSEDDETSSAGP